MKGFIKVMTKKEFIEQLRNALINEIPNQEVSNQLNYYDNYITNQSAIKGEAEVIKELGSPNLLAKTIIDAYKRSYGSNYSSKDMGQEDSTDQSFSSNRSDNKNWGEDNSFNKKEFKVRNIPWYIKFTFIMIAILIALLFIFIGTIFIRIVMFLLPIILTFLIILIILRIIRD